MDKLFLKIVIFFLVFSSAAFATEIEFGDWYGVIDEQGNKKLVGYSGTEEVMLTIYVDDKLITRLEFYPKRKIRLATFDHKRMRGMNFNSLYGFDHWIRPMKKYYRMQVWFGKDKRYEVFSLKGVAKGVNWLHSK